MSYDDVKCNSCVALKREIANLKNQLNLYKYDYLTGLPCRIDFENTYDNFFHDFNMFDKEFTLCIVDINDLHAINHEYGYKDGGDVRILEVSNCLESLFRSSNIFRIGGDEFSILTRVHTPKDIYNIICDSDICDYVSVGSSSPKDNRCDKSILFKRVDELMLKDKIRKKAGRSCIPIIKE
jgi:diguanylate cyclase (GGDEF)-like protein